MKRSKTSLLVGATGFVGHNLAHYLHARGERVVGTYIHPIAKGVFSPGIRLVRCDVTQKESLERLFRQFTPHYIYYLAAQSSIRHAWLQPTETIQINFLGGVYLLEVIKRLKLNAKVLIFSSGTTYGESHHSGKALAEEACLKPKDPYSVSKMSIDFFGRLYAKVHGMAVAVVRLANFTGPGQSTIFSIPNFASQIARIEAGLKSPTIEVGNLSARRDYLDIRDGVRAFYLAMKYGKKGEAYNIASGQSRTLRDVLDTLLGLSYLKRKSVKIRKTSTLIPKDEISEIRLSPTKFMRLTGWRPHFSFTETARDILNDWRSQVRRSSSKR